MKEQEKRENIPVSSIKDIKRSMRGLYMHKLGVARMLAEEKKTEEDEPKIKTIAETEEYPYNF